MMTVLTDVAFRKWQKSMYWTAVRLAGVDARPRNGPPEL